MSVINQADVQNICDSIEGIPTCDQLTAFALEQAELWAKKQVAALKAKASAEAKKVVPTDLSSVISWIQTFIDEAEAQYALAQAAIVEITAAYTQIAAAIASKASSMQCSTPPSLPNLPGA